MFKKTYKHVIQSLSRNLLRLDMKINHELPMIRFTEKKQQRLQDNIYAPLEPKTQKILERLKKRLENLDKQITSEKLEESKNKIQYWIERHTAQRVIINEKDFKLFTEGKKAAKMSRRVESFRSHLRDGFYNKAIDSHMDLKGRVKKAK